MLIDTHGHLNFNAYKDDADEVIRRSLSNDVWMINVGSQYSTSKRAVEIAGKYPEGVFAAVGLHPIHLSNGIFKVKIDPAELSSATHGASTEEIKFETRAEEFNYERYKELAKSKKVVAIGETGLDYYYRPKTPHQNKFGAGQAKIKLAQFKEIQRTVLCRQLELAKELNLPVIFHCRMAHDDLINILKNHLTIKPFNHLAGVIHCFTGTWEQAKQYLDMGFYLGFNGIIFKLNLDEIIKKTPLEKILIETDCPYLTPPLPNEEGPAFAKATAGKRNEPIFVKYVAEKIAKIKNISYEKTVETTTQNAKKLFTI